MAMGTMRIELCLTRENDWKMHDGERERGGEDGRREGGKERERTRD